MKRYKAKIKYTMDKDHPDKKYVEDWSEDKVMEFTDTYALDYDSDDYCIDVIKHDLKLVAGGGYNTEHIHNVKFEIERC